MSRYLLKLGEALTKALDAAASAQPEQFAGYVANIDFWLMEYTHLATIIEGYEARLTAMNTAYFAYVAAHGGPHNRDDLGTPFQQVRETSTRRERGATLTRNREAMTRVVKRASELELIDYLRHDRLLEAIGVSSNA